MGSEWGESEGRVGSECEVIREIVGSEWGESGKRVGSVWGERGSEEERGVESEERV